ncbi:MAG: YigZ family protein [Ardenticatenaceae bacterium]|nr:YigZ family protein [Ardenticatenaceae bacterium]
MSDPTNEMHMIPAAETRIELEIQRSRFIATAAPAFSVDEARAFIGRVKGEFSDASHNVPAFIIGHGASVTAHATDDGEPSGTAGRPMLAVLKGSGFGDIAVVVTRYFGGIKLGTGGLVRAYSDSVREVLAALPRAVKRPTYTVMAAVPYPLLEQVRLLVAKHRGDLQEESFAADVTMVIQLLQSEFEPFNLALSELSHGAVQAEIVEVHEATIFPLGD